MSINAGKSATTSENENDSAVDVNRTPTNPGDLEKIVSSSSDVIDPKDAAKVEQSSEPSPPYTSFSKKQKILIIGIVTAAAFLGPTSGAIYLPALPVFEDVFSASTTTINATVSVFMVFFAIAVCGIANSILTKYLTCSTI